MIERLDAATWAAVEVRLASVERFIPAAPPWRPSETAESDSSGAVRFGATFGRSGEGVRPRRRLLQVLVVVSALIALAAGALLFGGPKPEPKPDLRGGPFGPLGLLRSADAGSHAALLPDGRVLIVAGEWRGFEGTAVGRAEIWDPVEGITRIDPSTTARVSPTATLLLDGRVLIVGGFGGPFAYASTAVGTAEIWDPRTDTLEPTGSMAISRVGHTATMLADGRVLIVGGAGAEGAHATAELWDPATGEFQPAGRMEGARIGHLATLLPDGQVLVWGGDGPSQVWRPADENFTRGSPLDTPVFATATRLPDGTVLLLQGREPGSTWTLPPLIIGDEPGGRAMSGPLNEERTRFAATLLADGRVMITGGVSPTGDPLASVEIRDPDDGLFRAAPPLPRAVADHTALLLADGKVLIVFEATGLDGTLEPFVYEPEAIP